MAKFRNSPLQAQYALIGGTLLLAKEDQRIICLIDGTVISSITDPFEVLWATQRTINNARRDLFRATGVQHGNELVVPFTTELAAEIKKDPHGRFRKTLDHLAHLAPRYNTATFEREMNEVYGFTIAAKAS